MKKLKTAVSLIIFDLLHVPNLIKRSYPSQSLSITFYAANNGCLFFIRFASQVSLQHRFVLFDTHSLKI